jgi:tripartite-type tricarboxylate transporter receptor subunit TctC
MMKRHRIHAETNTTGDFMTRFFALPRKAIAVLAVTALACSSAMAAFPDKPIRVVIGFPAGGPLDQHARLLTERLQAVLGQPIVIDYKSGAGGTVGAQDVMKAAPDGYTLMLANTGVMVINPALYSKLPYQPRCATSRRSRAPPCSRWPCWSIPSCR